LHVDGQTVSASAVRAELRRVLDSRGFDASERNRGFLRHIVEETLAGRAERIKAYSIATSVFGRDEAFDPQLDSIVRIEAGRLRRSLERYYLTDGRDSVLRIEVPRGAYVPVFREARPTPRGQATGGPPSLLVTAFEAEGDQSAFPSFTRGFTRSLTIALTRFASLRVFGAETAVGMPVNLDPPGCGREVEFDYVVTGQTAIWPDRFEIDALLVEARSGRAVWADTFQRDLRPAEIVALRNEVANRVARALAQPYGAIHSDHAHDADGAPPETLGSYAAVLTFYAYWRTFDQTALEAVRVGLERAVAAEPGYAEAFACLSLVYSNAFRFGHTVDAGGENPQVRALALASRAVELAPGSSSAQYALGLARWFAGDPQAALEALETGRALNPNDTTIAADLGQRYAFLARWDMAVPVLEQAYASDPFLPSTHRVGLFLYHYAHGRYAQALDEARRIDAPKVLYGHVAVAAAAGMLGEREEAASAVVRILSLDPRYGEHVAVDLDRRHVAPVLAGGIVVGLVKAGLAVTAPAPSEGRRAS
jgi:adenylate cyclase